ncbi:DUF5979 domain-containing protein [Zhihengliuella sp. ISTPL4]|uniref:DUF5979 domain-containing protein n=1 Tax=Zhihengliuella sp. ISTPL4 TaxID=2058657 RepID=UPI0013052085|nr:DUF5979 domain-containing protein [Zhihengliuella sp. ISTPL4]
MADRAHPILRRFAAFVTAGALAVAGAVVMAVAVPAPAAADYPETVNPFAIGGGFTVYAREDALIRNQETEGSIAVGGTATVAPASASQYTIVHVAAGTGDYDLPVVDGDPTRFLVGRYSPESTGILAITSAGTTEPSLLGDLKMVQRDGPWQAFARANWLRLNQNPANADQTPLIDATHQRYPANAAPPTGAAGGGSIYTVNTSATAVADYVEANRDASWQQAQTCLADIADPTTGIGYPVTVAEDVGSRVVLAPLSADQPNIVDYADIAGTALIQFSPGPTPGVSNPLVIRVPAGTTEVIGARADPQGAYSPYIMWDLSQLTGDVTVRAAEARIDGSIYAPEASVTVDAAPLDGQVIGRNVTLLGGETHSFLFASEITCAADRGTFAIRKELSGIAPEDLPEGATFTLNYVATDPDGQTSVGTLEVPADGSPVLAEEQFPLGTTVEFVEIEPESVPGWEWGEPVIDPNPLTIGAGTAKVVITNTATAQLGTFSIRKSIDDVSGGSPGAPSQATVPVTWTATFRGEQIGSGTLDVPFDSTVIDVGVSFPVGTVITLSEDLTGIDPPDGYEWAGASWSPRRIFIIRTTSTVAVELVNAITPATAERSITIVKSVEGGASDTGYEYAVSYNTDPPGTRTQLTLPVGDPAALDDVESGADTLQLAELLPTYQGDPVDAAGWLPPVITVTIDGETTQYRPENFEGAGPLESAIVDIPLPASGDILIDITNEERAGTFELAKAFAGIPAGSIPSGLEFTVRWTAVLPTGETQTGTVRVPGDGTPRSPLDDTGQPILFPFGTTVTFDELAAPTRSRLRWEGRVFDPTQLVIGQGGETVVGATLTNSGTLLTGTFSVSKSLFGIDPDQVRADSFTIEYTAHLPGQSEPVTGTIAVPTDGTPASPLDASGEPVTFPLGTTIQLAEPDPEDTALPENFEWAGATWSPQSSLIIGLRDAPQLEVTNTAVELTRWALTKRVEGTDSLPPGTTFAFDWWADDVPQSRVEIEPGETIYSPYFSVGTVLEVREATPPAVPGITWSTPQWSVEGEILTPDEDGRVALPTTVSRDLGVAELLLTNTANSSGGGDDGGGDGDDGSDGQLPSTGGEPFSPLVILGALAAVLLGTYLAIRRRGRI